MKLIKKFELFRNNIWVFIIYEHKANAYRLIVYIIMKCKYKWILDKWDLCKTGTLKSASGPLRLL